MKGGWVYILTNKPRGTLYIGVTADLPRRLEEHRLSLRPSFAARYNLDKLVWCEFIEDIAVAIQRETSIKRWLRAWKIELIERSNPEWRDLSGEM
jgi:putative endonuclease